VVVGITIIRGDGGQRIRGDQMIECMRLELRKPFLLGLLAWCGFFLVSLYPVREAGAKGEDTWKYDRVFLKNGAVFQGLVLNKDSDGRVQFRQVSRKPGRATMTSRLDFSPREVQRVELLPESERALLKERLERLRAEREALAARLKGIEAQGKGADPTDDLFDFGSVAWEGGGKALIYESDYFRLISDARPELVRLAAIHLEQIYDAYISYLPPISEKKEPTTILLAHSWGSYQKLVQTRGLDLSNPAFYDQAKNEIVCGCDLPRLGSELEKAFKQHQASRLEVKNRLAELHRIYQGKIPAVVKTPIREILDRIQTADNHNLARFHQAQQQLFRRLYHEAFHAYLDTFVYPSRGEANPQSVPRWLNEGLAQIFETAIVEISEVRVKSVDTSRLQEMRQALARDRLLPVTTLLRSKRNDFLVAHSAQDHDRQISDHHYLASWALAYYLMFERKLLGTKALDEYVRSLERGQDPVTAFETLVGQPLPAFEKQFVEYLLVLRSDDETGS
jgi:hypothetical protein